MRRSATRQVIWPDLTRKESHDLGKKDRNPRVQIDALLLQAQLLNTKVLDKPEDKAMKPFTDRAVRTVNEALQVAGKAENRGLRALVLFKRAETMVLAGRHQTGLRDVKEASGIFEEMDHYQALGRCLLLSGNIKHALGQEEAGAADEKRLEKERAAQVQIEQPQLLAPQPGAAAAAPTAQPEAQSVAPAKPAGLDPVYVRKQLAAMVKDAIASDEELELDRMDSLSSVALMSMEFQMALSPSLVFDFPTLRAMEEHLVAESQGM
eukprot:s54_g9.t1